MYCPGGVHSHDCSVKVWRDVAWSGPVAGCIGWPANRNGFPVQWGMDYILDCDCLILLISYWRKSSDHPIPESNSKAIIAVRAQPSIWSVTGKSFSYPRNRLCLNSDPWIRFPSPQGQSPRPRIRSEKSLDILWAALRFHSPTMTSLWYSLHSH